MSFSLSELIYGSQSQDVNADVFHVDADTDMDIVSKQEDGDGNASNINGIMSSLDTVPMEFPDFPKQEYGEDRNLQNYYGLSTRMDTHMDTNPILSPHQLSSSQSPSHQLSSSSQVSLDLSPTRQQRTNIKFDFEKNEEDRDFYLDQNKHTTRLAVQNRERTNIIPKMKRVLDIATGKRILVLDETPEETAMRRQKQLEKRQRWDRMRKGTMWDFRSEIDVGNAIRYTLAQEREKAQMIAQQAQKAQTKKKQGKRPPTSKKRKRGQSPTHGRTSSGSDSDYVLSDSEESTSGDENNDDDGYGALIKRSKKIKDESSGGGKLANYALNPYKDPSHPKHYLYEGYSAPKAKDVEFNYIKTLKNGTISSRDKDAFLKKILTHNVTRMHTSNIGKNAKSRAQKSKKTNMSNMMQSLYFPKIYTKHRDVRYAAPHLDLGDDDDLYSQRYRYKLPPFRNILRADYLRSDAASSMYNKKEYTTSREVKSIASRYIVGCGSSGVLPYTPIEHVKKLLNMLQNTYSNADRRKIIFRQSQELASNYLLYNNLKEKIEELHKNGGGVDGVLFDDEDYEAIREELLTGDVSEFFTDPWTAADEYDFRLVGNSRRKAIFNFVERMHLQYIEGKRLANKSNDVDGGDFAQNKSQSRRKKDYQQPWHGSFSSTQTKKTILENMMHTNDCEKYTQVLHESPIDIGSVHLFFSLAMSTMTRLRLDEEGGDKSNRNKIRKIHHEIEEFFDHLSSTVGTLGVNSAHNFHKSLMSAPLAHVSLMRQSYLANSGMYGESEPQSGNDISRHENGLDASTTGHNYHNDLNGASSSSRNQSGLNYTTIANELVSYGQTLLDRKLRVFHPIHITTGIAMMARSLPPYAAEILCRPTFGGGNGDGYDHGIGGCRKEDTPFDLVRQALEEMERNNDISRDKNVAGNVNYGYGSSSVGVGKIISDFDNAIDIFYRILPYEPCHFDIYCWIVAARIGSLLVASGNTVGKGARAACPHDYNFDDDEVSKMYGRSRHDRYDELRAYASRVLRQFLILNSKSDNMGHRYFFAVKNLLEWKEAICLLAMRPHLDQSKFRRIRQLHAAHTLSWARFECSDLSLASLLRISMDGIVSKHQVFSHLGLLIECNPCDPKYWNILASGLVTLQGSRDYWRESHWWGRKFTRTWDDQFFNFPRIAMPKRRVKRQNNDVKLFEDLKEKMNQHLRNHAEEKSSDKNSFNWDQLIAQIDLSRRDSTWLWSVTPSDMDEEDHLDLVDDETGEVKEFDHMLPQKCTNNVSSLGEFNLVTNMFPETDSLSCALVVKAIVAQELYGRIFGPFKAKLFVRNTIYYLAKKCYPPQDNGELDVLLPPKEFKMLIWLERNTEISVRKNLDILVDDIETKIEEEENNQSVRNSLFQFATF